MRPLLKKGAGQFHRGGFGLVASSGLEGKAEDCDLQSAQAATKPASEGTEWKLPLSLVDINDGAEQVGTGTRCMGKMLEGADVLGKAGATVADPGKYPWHRTWSPGPDLR